MKSWKTTFGGALSALGLSILGAGDLNWLKPEHAYYTKLFGYAAGAIGVFFTGLWARDNNRTSEQVGAAPAPGLRPLGLPLIVLLAGLVLLVPACTTPTGSAGKVLATTVQTVDAAMQGWGTWVAAGHATAEQEARVKHFYGTYQAAELAAEDAYLEAVKTGQFSAWNTAAGVLRAAQSDLLAIIVQFKPPKTP